MTRAALRLLVALALAGFSHSAPAADEASALGFWLNQAQGWVVEAKPCATGVCGYLIGFRQTRGAGYVAKDWRNPDPKKRGRPLCGLMLLGGFTPSGVADGKWENGWVYDPDSGATYKGVAQMVDPDTVKLRGYILIPVFGTTITLTREVGTINRCAVPPQD